MTERGDLLASIASTIKDYRAGDIPEPTPDHVDRWIRQFDENVQFPMLRELDFVFKRTYVSKARVQELFSAFVDHFLCDFWRTAHILNIQQNGTSQSEIRKMVGDILQEKCGLDIDRHGVAGEDFVYLDDAVFTGNRVIQDLSDWINKSALKGIKIRIMTIAIHNYAEYQIDVANKDFNGLKEQNQIEVKIWRIKNFENRRTYRDRSDVLWPVPGVYDSDGFSPRMPERHNSRIFSCESGRQLLEREFLNAGVRIRGFATTPDRQLKPLGFSPFEPGFGSLFVTYRNCPNNCPLALWYGDPSLYPESHPLGKWYPLFPRKGYSL